MKVHSKPYIHYPDELFCLDDDLEALINFVHVHFESDIKKKLRFIKQKIQAKIKKRPDADLDVSVIENDKRLKIDREIAALKLSKRMLLKNLEYRWICSVSQKKYWQLAVTLNNVEKELGFSADEALKQRDQFKKSFSSKIQDLIILYASKHLSKLSDIEELVYKMNLFLKAGNDCGLWQICLIGSIVIADRDPSPMAKKGALEHAINFEKLHHALHRELPNMIHKPELLNEALYLSLMLDSYVLRKQVFMAVMNALKTEQNLRWIYGFVGINVSTSTNNPSRKVFLSPLTRFIWHHLKQHFEVIVPDGNMNFSRAFFQALRLHSRYTHQYKYPKAIRDWFNPVSSYLQLCINLPSLNLRYQKEDIAFSLKEIPFTRVFGLEEALFNNVDDFSITTKEPIKRIGKHRPNHALWSKASRLLDQKDVTDNEVQIISGRLKQLIKSPVFDVNEVLLLEWALDLMNPADRRAGNSPRKALDKVQNLVARVVGLASSVPITKLKLKDRQQLFEKVLEFSTSGNNYRFTSDNLFYFNHFLEFQHELEPLVDETLIRPSSNDGFYTINANVITFDEFEQVKTLLLNLFASTQERKYQTMTIIFIMGFRLGMRKEEVMGLKFRDFVSNGEESNLLLKESINRDLKTINAKRAFFLKQHMPADEIELLCNYQQLICEQFTNPSYFFAYSPRNRLSDAVTVTPLIEILRSQINNPNIGFHQLRHSKASWTMLMAFEGQYQLNLGQVFFSHLPRTREWLESSKERLQKILPSSEDFSKAAYWLHKKMGHGSLMMTLGHYVHFMDIIVAAFNVKAAKASMEKLIIDVMGMSRATAHNWHQNNYKDVFERLEHIKTPSENELLEVNKRSEEVQPSENLRNESLEKMKKSKFDEILEKNKKLSVSEIHFQLTKLIPYQLHQVWLKQSSEKGEALILAYGFDESVLNSLNDVISKHPKLGFKELPEKYNVYLLSYLQYFLSIESEFEFPSDIGNLFEIFERSLNVGYQKAKKGELRLVNNYSLKFTNLGKAQSFLKKVGFSRLHLSYSLICNQNNDVLKFSQEYWKPIIQAETYKLVQDTSKNKYGKLEVKFLMRKSDKQKFQAFYLSLVLVRLQDLYRDSILS